MHQVRGDEIGNQLVRQPFAAADPVEIGVEPFEHHERRLAHQFQHGILGMFRRHFEAARRMMTDDRIEVIAAVEQVVADTAADKNLLDPLTARTLA